MPIGVCEPLGEPVANIVIAKITSTRPATSSGRVEGIKKEKAFISFLVSTYGTASY